MSENETPLKKTEAKLRTVLTELNNYESMGTGKVKTSWIRQKIIDILYTITDNDQSNPYEKSKPEYVHAELDKLKWKKGHISDTISIIGKE